MDTVIFFSIAFAAFFNGFSGMAAEQVMWAQDAVPFLNAGPLVPLWVSLAVADWGVKIGIALIALVPFRIIVARYVPRQIGYLVKNILTYTRYMRTCVLVETFEKEVI